MALTCFLYRTSEQLPDPILLGEDARIEPDRLSAVFGKFLCIVSPACTTSTIRDIEFEARLGITLVNPADKAGNSETYLQRLGLAKLMTQIISRLSSTGETVAVEWGYPSNIMTFEWWQQCIENHSYDRIWTSSREIRTSGSSTGLESQGLEFFRKANLVLTGHRLPLEEMDIILHSFLCEYYLFEDLELAAGQSFDLSSDEGRVNIHVDSIENPTAAQMTGLARISAQLER